MRNRTLRTVIQVLFSVAAALWAGSLLGNAFKPSLALTSPLLIVLAYGLTIPLLLFVPGLNARDRNSKIALLSGLAFLAAVRLYVEIQIGPDMDMYAQVLPWMAIYAIMVLGGIRGRKAIPSFVAVAILVAMLCTVYTPSMSRTQYTKTAEIRFLQPLP